MKDSSFNIRISQDLSDRIDKEIERLKTTKTDWGTKALTEKLEGKVRPRDIPSLRPILNKIRGAKCSNPDCKKPIALGEPCLWAPGIVICMDCQIQRSMGDRSLVNKYLKTRKLERLASALRNECDRLADKIETLTAGDKLNTFLQESEKLHEEVFSYLKHVGNVSSKNEREILEKILRAIEEEMKFINDSKVILESKLKLKIRKKKGIY